MRARTLLGAATCAGALLLSATLPAGLATAEAVVPGAPRTIVDLQLYAQGAEIAIHGATGTGTASLVNLNPAINAWFLLTVEWQGPNGTVMRHDSYHLENPDPRSRTLTLTENGIALKDDSGQFNCQLWSAAAAELDQARQSSLPYAPLCGKKLFLRNPVVGARTQLEAWTDYLRQQVWGGEEIVDFVRHAFFQDAFLEKEQPAVGKAVAPRDQSDAPMPALLDPSAKFEAIDASDLGLDVSNAAAMELGRWYPVTGAAGIYVSAMEPRAISASVLDSTPSRVAALDTVESEAVDFLVAFDLSQFSLGFALGTDHPRLGWSDRALDSVRDPSLPGPDGIADAAPLVTNGMLDPDEDRQVAATFTGGFKREHGAFRYGALAHVNHGSHYGFIEQGVRFSTLQPGLATIYVLTDGTVGMKTWTEQDDALLPSIRFARQNGVPLIDWNVANDRPIPGALVTQWGAGNWSGSEDQKLRTLRAGACWIENEGRQFLIYGYFSTATPSAMVRIFQAYGCRYAMQLDMNALEHTYLAVYTRADGRLLVQHLIEGMSVLDRKSNGRQIPRFLGYPDNRDFFYLLRRSAAQ